MSLGPHWRGHLLLFDAKPRAAHPAGAGLRLVFAFVLLEAVIGPRFHLLGVLGLPQPEPWIRVAVLLALAIVLVRFFAGLKLAAIGFIPWREWSATEKSYFAQILIIANVVFALVIKGPPAGALAPAQWVVVVMTSFFWGFYQELVYRGMLQTEVTRRFGALAGVLAANIVFTFGPLHFYHFAAASPPIAMFAAIFTIGLFFGVLRHRSRNLWLPAVFHGIGTAWILGAA